MARQTIQNLLHAFDAIPFGRLRDEVNYMLDMARVNADDTCYVEKSRPAEDHETVMMDTLEFACTTSDAYGPAVAWFEANGVKF